MAATNDLVHVEEKPDFCVTRYSSGDLHYGDTADDGWGVFLGRGGFFEGMWSSGLPNGIGLAVKRGRPHYFGEFNNGKYHGIGRSISKVSCFLGEFKEGCKNGFGELIINHGLIVQGLFGSSLLHGFAVITDPVSKTSLQGTFRNGVLNGVGLTLTPDAQIFECFSDGKRHGEAIHLDRNKNLVKKCVYHEGKVTGCCKVAIGGEVYEGFMDEQVKHGIGRFKTKRETFVGIFHRGRKNGFGSLENQGMVYVGNFKEDEFEGVGLLKSKTKDSVYFGNFKAGVKEGLAFEYGDGKEFVGYYSNGKPEGFAIIKLNYQEERYGYFVNGKLVDFTAADNCKGLANHRNEMRPFIECCTRRIHQINEEIDSSLDPISLPLESIETNFNRQKQQLAETLNSYRERYESFTKIFDRCREELRAKLSIGGKQSTGIRLMKREEAQQIEKYISQYEQLIEEYGRYYKPSLATSARRGDETQTWLMYEKDISAFSTKRNATSPSRFLASAEERQLSLKFASCSERKELTEISNYQAFNNSKFESLHTIKLEGKGKIASDDDVEEELMDWVQPVMHQQSYTFREIHSRKLEFNKVNERYTIPPADDQEANPINGNLSSKALERYFNMIDSLDGQEHADSFEDEASRREKEAIQGPRHEPVTETHEEWMPQLPVQTEYSRAPAFTDPGLKHNVEAKLFEEPEKPAKKSDFYCRSENTELEPPRPSPHINAIHTLQFELPPDHENKAYVEPVPVDYCLASGLNYASIGDQTAGFSSNVEKTQGKHIENLGYFNSNEKPESQVPQKNEIAPKRESHFWEYQGKKVNKDERGTGEDDPRDHGSMNADEFIKEKKRLEALKMQLEMEMADLRLENEKIESEIYQTGTEDLKSKDYGSNMIGYRYRRSELDGPEDLP